MTTDIYIAFIAAQGFSHAVSYPASGNQLEVVMLRHIVLALAILAILAFVVLFGHGIFFAVPGSTWAWIAILGSLVLVYFGAALLYWHGKLDYAHTFRRFRYR